MNITKTDCIISMDDLMALCGLAELRVELIGDGADIENEEDETVIHLAFAD